MNLKAHSHQVMLHMSNLISNSGRKSRRIGRLYRFSESVENFLNFRCAQGTMIKTKFVHQSNLGTHLRWIFCTPRSPTNLQRGTEIRLRGHLAPRPLGREYVGGDVGVGEVYIRTVDPLKLVEIIIPSRLHHFIRPDYISSYLIEH